MRKNETIRLITLIACAVAAAAISGCPASGGDAETPTVLSTLPSDGAVGVSISSAVSATFSEDMDADSIGAAEFTLSGAGAVAGSVSYEGRVAVFQPDAPLAYGTEYHASISTGATDLAGNALASAALWAFTTAPVPDTTAPTVTAVFPATATAGVAIFDSISATFIEAMDPATVNSASFTLAAGAVPVGCEVSYSGLKATLNPDGDLSASTEYTATVGTDAADLAGNHLAAPYVWTFTTGAAVSTTSPLAVPLGTAGDYAILAQSQITNVPSSAISGDVGLSPAAEDGITGFALTDVLTGDPAIIEYATSAQVVGGGRIYAADMVGGTPVNTASRLTTAIEDKLAAYNDAFARFTPDFIDIGGGTINGQTFATGLYRWDSSVTMTGDIVLSGSATDVWIFQIVGELTVSSAKSIVLSGGALARNVFWQVSGVVTLGTTSHFEGIILCAEDIRMLTGSSLLGRALAKKQVILQQVTVIESGL